jgi:hypothetical protein
VARYHPSVRAECTAFDRRPASSQPRPAVPDVKVAPLPAWTTALSQTPNRRVGEKPALASRAHRARSLAHVTPSPGRDTRGPSVGARSRLFEARLIRDDHMLAASPPSALIWINRRGLLFAGPPGLMGLSGTHLVLDLLVAGVAARVELARSTNRAKGRRVLVSFPRRPVRFPFRWARRIWPGGS